MISPLSAEPPLSLLLSTKSLVSINVNTSAAWKRRNIIHPRLPLLLVLAILLAIPNLNLKIPLRQTWSRSLTLPIPLNLTVLSRMLKKHAANRKAFASTAPILLMSGLTALVVSPTPPRLTPFRSFLLILLFLPAPRSLFSRETAILKSPRGRRLEQSSA